MADTQARLRAEQSDHLVGGPLEPLPLLRPKRNDIAVRHRAAPPANPRAACSGGRPCLKHGRPLTLMSRRGWSGVVLPGSICEAPRSSRLSSCPAVCGARRCAHAGLVGSSGRSWPRGRRVSDPVIRPGGASTSRTPLVAVSGDSTARVGGRHRGDIGCDRADLPPFARRGRLSHSCLPVGVRGRTIPPPPVSGPFPDAGGRSSGRPVCACPCASGRSLHTLSLSTIVCIELTGPGCAPRARLARGTANEDRHRNHVRTIRASPRNRSRNLSSVACGWC